jgi:hypothetical protein
MKFGAYRVYFHIPFTLLGIKIAYFGDSKNSNRFCSFLCGIIMNILEWKRYLYYCKKKPMKNWGKKWKCARTDDIWFNPTYITFGLFNIVHHCKYVYDKTLDELAQKKFYEEWPEKDLEIAIDYMSRDLKPDNFGLYKGHPVLLDYGDFNVDCFNSMNVKWIDYR